MSKISKEEILQKNHTISSPVFGYIQVDKSMDEYAEQIAIGFKNWLDARNRLILDEAGQMPIIPFSKYETNESLYQQYIKSITL